jgi:hypothetical protein
MEIKRETFRYFAAFTFGDDAPIITPGTEDYYSRPLSMKYKPTGVVIVYEKEPNGDWKCAKVTVEGVAYRKDGTVSRLDSVAWWWPKGGMEDLADAPEFVRYLVKNHTPKD